METSTTALYSLVWTVSTGDKQEISLSSTGCRCIEIPETKIIERGYSGYDLAGNILISIAFGVAFGFWLGVRWVWIGKAGKKHHQ